MLQKFPHSKTHDSLPNRNSTAMEKEGDSAAMEEEGVFIAGSRSPKNLSPCGFNSNNPTPDLLPGSFNSMNPPPDLLAGNFNSMNPPPGSSMDAGAELSPNSVQEEAGPVNSMMLKGAVDLIDSKEIGEPSDMAGNEVVMAEDRESKDLCHYTKGEVSVTTQKWYFLRVIVESLRRLRVFCNEFMIAYPHHEHMRRLCVVCAIYFLLKPLPWSILWMTKKDDLIDALDGKEDDLIDALDLKYPDRILFKFPNREKGVIYEELWLRCLSAYMSHFLIALVML